MKFSKLQATGNECILADSFTQTVSLEVREPEEDETESQCKRGNSSVSTETSSGIKQDIAHVATNKVKRVDVNISQPQFQLERISAEVKVDIIIINKTLTALWNRVGEFLISGAVKKSSLGNGWKEGTDGISQTT